MERGADRRRPARLSQVCHAYQARKRRRIEKLKRVLPPALSRLLSATLRNSYFLSLSVSLSVFVLSSVTVWLNASAVLYVISR